MIKVSNIRKSNVLIVSGKNNKEVCGVFTSQGWPNSKLNQVKDWDGFAFAQPSMKRYDIKWKQPLLINVAEQNIFIGPISILMKDKSVQCVLIDKTIKE